MARGIERWQAVEGFMNAEFVRSKPAAKPNPKILLHQILADGTVVVAVWAYVRSLRAAKLVTLFFED